MAYSTPTENGQPAYSLTFTHTASGVQFQCDLVDPSNNTDATKDSIFQAFHDKVATLTGCVINTATKQTTFISNVT